MSSTSHFGPAETAERAAVGWDDTRYHERRTEPKSSAGILKTGDADHGSAWMQPSAPPLVGSCVKSLFCLECADMQCADMQCADMQCAEVHVGEMH